MRTTSSTTTHHPQLRRRADGRKQSVCALSDSQRRRAVSRAIHVLQIVSRHLLLLILITIKYHDHCASSSSCNGRYINDTVSVLCSSYLLVLLAACYRIMPTNTLSIHCRCIVALRGDVSTTKGHVMQRPIHRWIRECFVAYICSFFWRLVIE